MAESDAMTSSRRLDDGSIKVGRVFVSRLIPDAGLDQILASTEAAVWTQELPPPRDVLLSSIEGCDGVLTLLTDQVDKEFLDHAGERLKVISNFAVGFDNVDVPECTLRGIAVGHTPGVLTETTADLAWTLLMAAARRIVEAADYVRLGGWKTWGPRLLLGSDVHGATVGIIGFGRIGQAMAQRARGFDMNVLYHDVHAASSGVEAATGTRFVQLDSLLTNADFVSLHVSLTSETHHLINPDTLRLMKPNAVLVNTSRGQVVDTDALVDALRTGTIAAAALDVTDPEPLPTDHALLGLSNCIVVPHIASASARARGRMAEMAAGNLLAGVRGERIPFAANPEVYSAPADR